MVKGFPAGGPLLARGVLTWDYEYVGSILAPPMYGDPHSRYNTLGGYCRAHRAWHEDCLPGNAMLPRNKECVQVRSPGLRFREGCPKGHWALGTRIYQPEDHCKIGLAGHLDDLLLPHNRAAGIIINAPLGLILPAPPRSAEAAMAQSVFALTSDDRLQAKGDVKAPVVPHRRWLRELAGKLGVNLGNVLRIGQPTSTQIRHQCPKHHSLKAA